MPLVSIGLPVYNGERFLKEALDSLLTQTYEDFELIISDNASTDGTESICRAYMEQDRRIRYFRNAKNIGAAKNFNRVFELSDGKYFKWHSADDLCAPYLVEKCKGVLDEHPEVILCHPKTTLIDAHGNVIRQYDDDLDLRFARTKERFRQLNMRLGLCNAHYGLLRSRLLRKTSLLGDYIESDVVFFAELTLYGQFFEIPEYLFFRRFHSQASSSITSIEKLQEFYNPESKGKFLLREWKHLFEHLRSIKRAPLDFTEKIDLAVEVMRMARWSQKKLQTELISALKTLLNNLSIRRKKTTEARHLA